jgi:hypothetical protein
MDENKNVPKLTEEEQKRYNEATRCENCKVEFNTMREGCTCVVKVRNHDHVTNNFIGAWCSLCNIRNNNHYFKTMVMFNNFSGYDGHFIIKYATKFMHEFQPYCYNTQKLISKSSQKIKHLQYSKYIFIDSLNHLNSSLDKMVETLKKSNHEYKIFHALNLNPILRSKGIYPYRWVDSINKFKEKQLPPIEWFDNDLTGEKCTPERYTKALEVWNTLQCETFGEYHMAYLKSDVALLAEVFENYRESCMKMFGLDPARLCPFNR